MLLKFDDSFRPERPHTLTQHPQMAENITPREENIALFEGAWPTAQSPIAGPAAKRTLTGGRTRAYSRAPVSGARRQAQTWKPVLRHIAPC